MKTIHLKNIFFKNNCTCSSTEHSSHDKKYYLKLLLKTKKLMQTKTLKLQIVLFKFKNSIKTETQLNLVPDRLCYEGFRRLLHKGNHFHIYAKCQHAHSRAYQH